jgi:hypothetical protein
MGFQTGNGTTDSVKLQAVPRDSVEGFVPRGRAMISRNTTGNRPSIEADQGRVWVAEGERAARGGEPIESNPYEGREQQVPRLLWLRGFYTAAAR